MAQRETAVIRSPAWRDAVDTLVLLMAPSTPFVAEELWQQLGRPYSVHHRDWPVFDATLLTVEEVELVVQVNGKVRERLTVPIGLSEEEALAQVSALPKVREQLGDRLPAKVVYVPGRLINLVFRA